MPTDILQVTNDLKINTGGYTIETGSHYFQGGGGGGLTTLGVSLLLRFFSSHNFVALLLGEHYFWGNLLSKVYGKYAIRFLNILITYQLNSFSPTEHLRGSEKSFKYSELQAKFVSKSLNMCSKAPLGINFLDGASEQTTGQDRQRHYGEWNQCSNQ